MSALRHQEVTAIHVLSANTPAKFVSEKYLILILSALRLGKPVSLSSSRGLCTTHGAELYNQLIRYTVDCTCLI